MAYEIVIAIILLATLPAWFFKKKFGMEIQGPLVLWRTKHGLRIIDRLARYQRFWKAMSDIGLMFSFGIIGAAYLVFDAKKRRNAGRVWWIAGGYLLFMAAAFTLMFLPYAFVQSNISLAGMLPLESIFVLFLGGFGFFVVHALLSHTVTILINISAGVPSMPGIQPVIPGVRIPGAALYVPLIGGVIGIVILMIVHEFSHGVLARIEKIRVKAIGVVTIGIFPIGAFAEPDEKKLKRVSEKKRMRVFAAGSMANFITCFIFVAMLIPMQLYLMPGIQQYDMENIDHIVIGTVMEGSPAEAAGITSGMKVYNPQALLTEHTPDSTVTLQTDSGPISVTRGEDGLIGLMADYQVIAKPGFDIGVEAQRYGIEIVFWTFFLNLVVAMINYMPFAIFDGARLFEDLLEFYFGRWHIKKRKKLAKRISYGFTLFILLLLLINVMPYFI